MYRSFGAALLLLAVVGISMSAPLQAAADDSSVRITRMDVTGFPAVSVVTSVIGSAGPITDLQPNEVVVTENGRVQRSSLRTAGEVTPVSLVLALDTSGSMAGQPLADAQRSLKILLASLAPADLAGVVTFNTAAAVSQGLTTDRAAVVAAVDRVRADGNTAVLDAVATAMDVLSAAPAKSRKAIVLLTDGMDTSSRSSAQAITDRLAGAGYPLYAFGLGSSIDRPVLQRLADASAGGVAAVAPDSTQLAAVYSALARQIALEYEVTYRSDQPTAVAQEGRTVVIHVARAGATIGEARATYSVPAGFTSPATPSPQAVLPVPVLSTLPSEAGPTAPIVALLGAAAVLSLQLWLVGMYERERRRRTARRRVASLSADAASPADRANRRRRVGALRPLLSRVAQQLTSFAPTSVLERTGDMLARAGYPLALQPIEFIALRALLAVVSMTVFAILGARALPELLMIILCGGFGLLLGYLIPGILVQRAIRTRRAAILRALPSVLDMLAISARAGATFDGAVSQVVDRWDTPLTDELRLLLAEFRMGRDRRESLRAFASRTGLPEVARFTNSVVRADALGVPISKVLLDEAVDMRVHRRQRAEGEARKAPVKMLLPMVTLVFPALFVVILGPAAMRILELFRYV